MDRRLTPMTGGVALRSLAGRVTDARFVDGEAGAICQPLVDLCAATGGARDRQVLLGDAVTVVDRTDAHVFVQMAKDGYCGWVAADAIGPPVAATHWVAAPASHLYSGPKVQARERAALPMGARLAVLGQTGSFAETAFGFVPAVHLRPLGQTADDPVQVAETFLNAPYLWGGNSHAGVDCSGLVQLAFHACGRACPGDSDLQQQIGQPLPDDAPLVRGDLLFWKGHVAMVVDAQRLIHANGHSMSVAYEGIRACIDRVVEQGGGPVMARRRP